MSVLPVPGLITSEEAADRLGIPYRSLMRWVESGVLVPYRAGARKRAPRLWSELHLQHARWAIQLRNDGAGDDALRSALTAIRTRTTGERFLVLGRDGTFADLVRSEERVGALLKGRKAVLVLDLEAPEMGGK